jgi:hypothetical protein
VLVGEEELMILLVCYGVIFLLDIWLFWRCSFLHALVINLVILSTFLAVATIVWEAYFPVWRVWDTSVLYAIGPFVFSLVTSLGIAIVSMFVALMQLAKWVIWRLESRKLWWWLNFEKKPSQAAAIVVIVLLTLVFWPVAIMRR